MSNLFEPYTKAIHSDYSRRLHRPTSVLKSLTLSNMLVLEEPYSACTPLKSQKAIQRLHWSWRNLHWVLWRRFSRAVHWAICRADCEDYAGPYIGQIEENYIETTRLRLMSLTSAYDVLEPYTDIWSACTRILYWAIWIWYTSMLYGCYARVIEEPYTGAIWSHHYWTIPAIRGHSSEPYTRHMMPMSLKTTLRFMKVLVDETYTGYIAMQLKNTPAFMRETYSNHTPHTLCEVQEPYTVPYDRIQPTPYTVHTKESLMRPTQALMKEQYQNHTSNTYVLHKAVHRAIWSKHSRAVHWGNNRSDDLEQYGIYEGSPRRSYTVSGVAQEPYTERICKTNCQEEYNAYVRVQPEGLYANIFPRCYWTIHRIHNINGLQYTYTREVGCFLHRLVY